MEEDGGGDLWPAPDIQEPIIIIIIRIIIRHPHPSLVSDKFCGFFSVYSASIIGGSVGGGVIFFGSAGCCAVFCIRG